MSVFFDQLTIDAKAVEDCLTAEFKTLRHTAAPRLIDAMAYGVMAGGKRLRGGLVLGSARLAWGGNNTKNEWENGAVRVAAAFECLHAYSLIHDDLPAMDNAEMRRGKPSCHLAFDEATAILSGDALQTMAFGLLADPLTHPDGNIRAGLVADLAAASGAIGMAAGQMLDLEAETHGFDLDETLKMQSLKTGALIRGAAVAGGRVGGGDNDSGGGELLDALGRYADNIGLAFQIADDLLDRRGDNTAMGKPTGRDEGASKASVIDLMGAEKAEEKAALLITNAKKILYNTVGSSAPHLDYMINLANFMLRRDH
ncbi:MAG: polyprenyl synthetase family protein [Candidatus Puniceispirillales bacterium WSBS_2018_MAG_OTU23]